MVFVYSHFPTIINNSGTFPHHTPLTCSLLLAFSNYFLSVDLSICVSHRWIISDVAFHDRLPSIALSRFVLRVPACHSPFS